MATIRAGSFHRSERRLCHSIRLFRHGVWRRSTRLSRCSSFSLVRFLAVGRAGRKNILAGDCPPRAVGQKQVLTALRFAASNHGKRLNGRKASRLKCSYQCTEGSSHVFPVALIRSFATGENQIEAGFVLTGRRCVVRRAHVQRDPNCNFPVPDTRGTNTWPTARQATIDWIPPVGN